MEEDEVTTATLETEPDTPPEDATVVASTPVPVLYKWSSWVHIGPGAQSCEGINEQEDTNNCSNPLHFHAWVRLPNPFQHREIREKALAARARKARLFRDPESDAYAVLEDDLDEIARQGDLGKRALVDDLMEKYWWPDYLEASKDLHEQDGETEDDDKPWAHVHDDQRRYDELAALPEDERPGDEYEALGRHLTAYNEALKAAHDERLKPRREALETRSLNELLDDVRSDRIKAAANEEFMHVYSVHSWIVGVFRYKGGPLVFSDVKDLQKAAPEVIDALKETFDDLEQTKAAQDAEGNH